MLRALPKSGRCLESHRLATGLFINGSTALVDPGRLFSVLIYTQPVGLLGRGSARLKAATYT
jgi:hypothetical protein